jgi:three-Cys-motif partner protein
MSDPKFYSLQDSAENWGGIWTERKLDAFSKYVRAYLTILKSNRNLSWKTIYFDGFAGSGSRRNCKKVRHNQLQITPEEESVYQGAAERVVKLDKTFDYYYFIDNQKGLEKLKAKLSGLPESKGKALEFRQEDCNSELKKLAGAMQSNKYAALVLLDPFGMHVDWTSIAALKGTRTDIWILLPTGVIINRLIDRAGMLRNTERLESFFGLSEQEIRKEFYEKEEFMTFFGDNEITKKIKNPIPHIANLYIRQLSTVWDYVTDTPLVLHNSKNTPIFHFVFASNNKIARKIAGDIIGKM